MGMDENLIPDWMKKKRDEQQRAKLEEEATMQINLVNQQKVESRAPIFWSRLTANLKAATEALSTLGMEGSFTSIGDKQLRIQVSKPGLYPNFTYTDLFFDDSPRIRCNTLDAGFYTLEFRLDGYSELTVVPSGQWSARQILYQMR